MDHCAEQQTLTQLYRELAHFVAELADELSAPNCHLPYAQDLFQTLCRVRGDHYSRVHFASDLSQCLALAQLFRSSAASDTGPLVRALSDCGQPHWRPLLTGLFPEGSPAVTAQQRHFFDWAQRRTEQLKLGTTSSRGTFVDSPTPDGQPPALTHHLYERLLAEWDRKKRSRRGVYYTPAPVVRSLLQGVESHLTRTLRVEGGWASDMRWQQWREANDMPATQRAPTAPVIQVLDPAMGSGIFPAELIHLVRAKFREDGGAPATWESFVRDNLLPRLAGFELLLPAAMWARLLIGWQLAKTGVSLDKPLPLELHWLDTLAPPKRQTDPVEQQRWQRPFSVIIGNPPFAANSVNRHRWLYRLMRGHGPDGRNYSNYFSVAGQPLAERKHWLGDDYVKFLRFAHWKIEQNGFGVVALVTNRGYLENTTMRGLRSQLVDSFSAVDVVDLRGDAARVDRRSRRPHDESVFEIGQGTALGIFAKAAATTGCRVRFGQLIGNRQLKRDQLASSPWDELLTGELQPSAPDFALVPRCPRGPELDSRYRAGCPLNEIMPVRTTAPVTARDGVVVAFDEGQLIDRLREFADLNIAEDDLRRRFFSRSRSHRYPPGDTRSWSLNTARQRLRELGDWQQHIRRCCYRPFDDRVIFWADWMVDWPRNQVMRHLLTNEENIALVTRRQVPANEPCDYFWVVDSIALDGVIRSDNRGSESLFPQYLHGVCEPGPANYEPGFVERVCARYECRWLPRGSGDLQQSIGPDDLLGLLYSQFSCRTYRDTFAASLRDGFPRCFLPRRLELFRELVQRGRKLVSVHCGLSNTFHTQAAADEIRLSRGKPDYHDGAIRIDDELAIPAERRVWEFRVGGHQICRKWLRDRRPLTARDLERFRLILRAIRSTLRLSNEIDAWVAQAGGWWQAFTT